MRLGHLFRPKDRGEGERLPKEDASETTALQVVSLPIDQIQPNPYQPRRTFLEESIEELAQSIKENGLLQPIVVRRASGGGYELLVGERRLRACQRLGYTHVDAVIRDAETEEMALAALIENIQREDLSLFDEVGALRRLVEEFGISQQDLARALGRSPSTIANKLRLLKLHPKVQEIITKAGLSERHARALLAFESSEMQIEAAEHIARRGLSVRQAEEWIAKRLAEGERSKRNQTIRAVYKDARLFVNSIRLLVKQLEEAGVGVDLSEESTEEYVEVRVRIRTGRGDD